MSDVSQLDTDAREGDDPEPVTVDVLDTTGRPAERPDPPLTGEVVATPALRDHKTIPGSDLPVVPAGDELRYLAQMATTLAYANAVPGALRGKPNDVLLVLMSARDLGVALTTAMREFHVIDGRVTISPKAKLAMVRAAGLGRIWPDPGNDDKSATWYATRGDMGDLKFSATYTHAMAERANLTKKDNWKAYPERMLSWRAVGYLLDDVFGEVATGLYSPDEVGAVMDEDGEPVIDATSVGPLPGMRGRRGDSTGPDPMAIAPGDELTKVQARIDKISAHHPDARAALLKLWTFRAEPNADPRLPRPTHLRNRDLAIAEGILCQIEDRIAGGEWTSTSEPPADPAALAAGPDAPTPENDPPEPDTAADLNVMLAEVDGWSRKDLDEQCKTLGVSTRGAMDVVKDRYRDKLRELAAEDASTGQHDV